MLGIEVAVVAAVDVVEEFDADVVEETPGIVVVGCDD